MTFLVNPLTGQLQPIYIPPYIIGTNSIPLGAPLTLQPTQQMIVLGDFNISDTLIIQGEMIVL